jgi:CRISPR/Cas system-associated exonuclease Cas4 (RecB family)
VPQMNEYWRKMFKWSKSKQDTFDGCRRKFYYAYIARYEGYQGNPLREQVLKLKDLKALPMWQGEIIHQAVQNTITQAELGRTPNPAGAEKMIETAVARGRQAAKTMFVEEVNGIGIAPEKFDRVRDEAIAQIKNFCEIVWPNYEKVEQVRHEDFDEFPTPSVTVVLKADFVSRAPNGIITITDWKTGKEDTEEIGESRQLTTYILWATKKFALPPERVRGELVYLKTGTTNATKRSAAELEGFEKQIQAWSKEILSVSEEGDLPPKPDEWSCRSCPFATMCTPGKGYL